MIYAIGNTQNVAARSLGSSFILKASTGSGFI